MNMTYLTINNHPSSYSVLCSANKFVPIVACFLHLIWCWPSPRVSGTASGSFSLGIPFKGLSGNWSWIFPQSVPYPGPLRLWTCKVGGSCFVSCQRSFLVLWFGQKILNILLRHLFINDYIFMIEATVLQVSAP
jgi:hypothetical protein